MSQFETLVRRQAAGFSTRHRAASMLRRALEDEQAGIYTCTDMREDIYTPHSTHTHNGCKDGIERITKNTSTEQDGIRRAIKHAGSGQDGRI